MNRKIFICVAFILLLLPAYAFPSGLGTMRVSLIEGDAQMVPADGDADSDRWVPLAINTPLREGDRIWVPEDGRLEISLRDGTFLRLDENSALEILTVDDTSPQFYMSQGHAYLNFSGLKNNVVQIDTPVSSVRTYDRSRFMIDVSRDGRTEISVLKGVVYAESRSGRTRVASGKALAIDEEYADLYPLGPADAWERWNRDRDDRYEDRKYGSSRYLPEELDSYAYDFDDNGRWVYVKEYGQVWTPTVHVSVGWSPYRHGRWAWIGGDFVWISYEPWGWAPYHYGRWTYVTTVGWCWVPPPRGAVYWGPGFVGWVHTPTYVAWVPLAPGEVYYGYGYYGPHSVNVININIQKTIIKPSFRHASIRDAVVVVHNETFRTGKPVEFRPKSNPFLSERISVGRPDIKPTKALMMPVVKEVSRAKLPPRQIAEVSLHELKRERPFVKEKSGSVLSPHIVQKNMPVREIQEPRERKFKSSVGPEVQRQLKAEEPGRPAVERQPEKTPEKIKEPAVVRPAEPKRPAFERQTEKMREPAVVRPAEPERPAIEKRPEKIREPRETRPAPSVEKREERVKEPERRIIVPPSPAPEAPKKSYRERQVDRPAEVRESPVPEKRPSQSFEMRPSDTPRRETMKKSSEAPSREKAVTAAPAPPPAPVSPPPSKTKEEKSKKEPREPMEQKSFTDTPRGPGSEKMQRGFQGR